MSKSNVKKITKESLRDVIRGIYINHNKAGETITPTEVADLANDNADWGEYTVEQLKYEHALKVAKSVEKQLTKPVPVDVVNGQKNLFPSDYDEHGFTINGGFIKHRNASAPQITQEFKNKSDHNMASNNAFKIHSDRYAAIIDGFLANPVFTTVGEVVDWIRNKD